MKRCVLIILIALLPMGSLSAQTDTAIPGCEAEAVQFFAEEILPLYEDYTRLREAFVEDGDFGVTGGELIALREGLETAIEASPTCLHGLSLQMVMSVSNMQTAILFLILSFEVDDSELRASLGEIGSHYARRSDSQFQAATETIAGWGAAPLAMANHPGGSA